MVIYYSALKRQLPLPYLPTEIIHSAKIRLCTNEVYSVKGTRDTYLTVNISTLFTLHTTRIIIIRYACTDIILIFTVKIRRIVKGESSLIIIVIFAIIANTIR